MTFTGTYPLEVVRLLIRGERVGKPGPGLDMCSAVGVLPILAPKCGYVGSGRPDEPEANQWNSGVQMGPSGFEPPKLCQASGFAGGF